MSQSTRAGTAQAATGKCTITLPVTGRGSTWIGTISVVNSPSSARWTLTLNGSDIAGLYGTSSYGPILWTGTEPLSLSSTGPTLVNGTTYRASLVGVEYATPKQVPTSIPTPASMAVTEVTLKGGTIDIGSVTTIKVVESITAGNVNSLVANQTGTIIQTGDKLTQIKTATVTTNAQGQIIVTLGHLSFTYGALLVVVRNAVSGVTSLKAYCVTFTSGNIQFTAAFGPSRPFAVGEAYAIIPTANSTTNTPKITIHTGTPTTSLTYTIAGLTSNPGVQLRSDGRTYPIGSHIANVAVTAAGTHSLIAAPTSPLRVMLKSVSIFGGATTSGVSLGWVRATIEGNLTPIVGAGGGTGNAAQTSITWESGMLIDPGQGVGFQITTASVQGFLATATYDLVV